MPVPMYNVAVYNSGHSHMDISLLAGIFQETTGRADWRVCLQRMPEELLPKRLQPGEFDGALVTSHMPLQAQRLTRAGIPWVSMGFTGLGGGDSVVVDNEMLGAECARHLIQQGYRRFVFIANPHSSSSPTRGVSFAKTLKGMEKKAETFVAGQPAKGRKRWSLEQELKALSAFLLKGSGPVGLFANDDVHAERAVEAARLAGLSIPQDIGICCHSLNDLFCRHCHPPLSSITFDFRHVGRAAARLLARRLEHPQGKRQRVCIPPVPLVTRFSSDLTAVSDPGIAKFLRSLRESPDKTPDFNAAARAIGMSRSTFERRVRAVTGQTPGGCLRDARTRKALQLLRESELDLTEISLECGFASRSVLCRVIKASTGSPPGHFRNFPAS
ncbi:MAG: substrate-binding domain-containing protein [Oceanipulchritudo sp.]